MERFKVTLGEHSHTIGTKEPGVLTIVVSAVSRGDGTPGPPRECRLEVGGLDSRSGSHFTWGKHDLVAGDKIEIEILDEGPFNEPRTERSFDLGTETEKKKDYVRKLADEFGWKIDESE